jgi:predicted lipase
VSLYDSFYECLKIGDNYTHVENDGDYHIKREGNILKIFFEWSDGKADWLNNFKFFPIPWKPYKNMSRLWYCHRGFLKVWKSIEPYLKADINDTKIREIEIVGYSHGAAIALLCYEYCKYNRADADVRGVGFGCPRVFWCMVPKEIKERFNNFVVVRNGADIVTHVPPVIFGFRHVSKVIKIGKDDDLIKDHYSDRYLQNLKGVDIQ